MLHGSFLAELTKEVLSDLEASKYQHAEYRISIYGRKRVEWDILAAWIVQNSLCSDNVVWLIQASHPAPLQDTPIPSALEALRSTRIPEVAPSFCDCIVVTFCSNICKGEALYCFQALLR